MSCGNTSSAKWDMFEKWFSLQKQQHRVTFLNFHHHQRQHNMWGKVFIQRHRTQSSVHSLRRFKTFQRLSNIASSHPKVCSFTRCSYGEIMMLMHSYVFPILRKITLLKFFDYSLITNLILSLNTNPHSWENPVHEFLSDFTNAKSSMNAFKLSSFQMNANLY